MSQVFGYMAQAVIGAVIISIPLGYLLARLLMEKRQGVMIRFLRLPSWSLSIGRWRYYGWRWGAHLGPVLVLIGRIR